MKIYLISQEVNNDYDTFDSAVVYANNEDEARNIEVGSVGEYGTWAAPKHVKVDYLGEAKEGVKSGIVLSSFNAG